MPTAGMSAARTQGDLSLQSRLITAARRRLGGISAAACVGAYLLFQGVPALSVLARYEWNPTALVRFGQYYVQQNPDLTPRGAVRLTGNESYGGNGYDGQIFYYYARTLFEEDRWPAGFSRAYRAPRVGYPLLVACFGGLGDWGLVAGLILTQIGLFATSIVCLHRLLPAERKWPALFYALSPFALISALLLVSDSVMIALLVTGYSAFVRAQATGARVWLLPAWLCFALAILTKEPALFLLFPLGLFALLSRRYAQAAFFVSILLPAVLWQLYLRSAHGMVPAGILTIFFAPFAGVFEVIAQTVRLSADLLQAPGATTLLALTKHVAKLLLVCILAALFVAPFTGRVRQWQQTGALRLGLVLVALSILFADAYYFWGIFDNVARMFTVAVPLLALLRAEDDQVRAGPAIFFTGVLSAFVFVRVVALTPAFPYDIYEPYSGPSYAGHAPRPTTP